MPWDGVYRLDGKRSDGSDPRDYHPSRPDGSDRNLRYINLADFNAGARCICTSCVEKYLDCCKYKNQLDYWKELFR